MLNPSPPATNCTLSKKGIGAVRGRCCLISTSTTRQLKPGFTKALFAACGVTIQIAFRDMPTGSMMYVLAADPEPVRKDGTTVSKLGMHLFWPDYFVDNETVLTVRRFLIHRLQELFTVEKLIERWNLKLTTPWTDIVDKSVCDNSQIRLPGSRKLVRQKCKCSPTQPMKCCHETFEQRNMHTKKMEPVTWYESSRYYKLVDILRPDGTHIDEFGVSIIADDIAKLCHCLSLFRPGKLSPLAIMAGDVPDTEDDTASRRKSRKRSRAVGRQGESTRGLRETDLRDDLQRITQTRNSGVIDSHRADGTDAADRHNEADGPDGLDGPDGADSEKPSGRMKRVRELFFQSIATWFPEDFRNADTAKMQISADTRYVTAIISEMFCENRADFHNNRAGVIKMDTKTGVMTRSCFCRHREGLGRHFGSCRVFRIRVSLRRGF
jgi:hypothetical protein